MIPQGYIKELLFSGTEFMYQSYNHRAAVEEMKTNCTDTCTTNVAYGLPESMWIIPDEVIQNHRLWRKGKLRSIHFKPNGEIYKVLIGARYSKTFYVEDFGITVKPIIFKSDDELDLINQNMAFEASL